MWSRLIPPALLAALALAAPASAQSPTGVVISEFRVDGPTGASNEFVELRNTSAAAVDISGWRLQGCAAASGAPSDRVAIPADTTLPAGASYLFGDAGYTGPPAANASYTTGIANAGGLRIVTATGTVVDGVGSSDGAADECREGAGLNLATTAPDRAFERKAGGTQDTDVNADDFDPPSGLGDPQRCDTCSGPVEPTITKIHDIQGPASDSPLAGQDVTIEGIVTGVDDEDGANFERSFPADAGVYVQEEPADADDDPATSEGIFVGFVDSRMSLPPGTKVRLKGRVKENFPPNGETRIEEAINTEPEVIATGQAVPDAVVIDPAAAAAQDPVTRPYYERLEGMRVALEAGTATAGGTNKFGELFMTPGVGGDRVFRTDTAPDLIAADADAGAGDPQNPLIDTDSETAIDADLFDVVRGVVGPLGFSFANFRIINQLPPAPQPTVQPSPAAPYPYDGVRPAASDQLRFATYNVENFFPVGGDVDRHLVTQEEYEAKRDDIVHALGDRLRRPDVIALQEVVDKAIADDVAAQLGGYTAYLEEGNDDRGIDVAILVKDTVRASNLRQLGKDATTPRTDCADAPSPGEEPRLFDRPPLAIDLERAGVHFTVVSNHFASKSHPDECRAEQAAFVRDFVAGVEADGGEAIVAGDLNSFEDEVALDVLQDGTTTLDNLWDLPPAEQRYSFHFQGRLQTLDHVLVTDGLRARVDDFAYVHLGNDYYDRRTPDDGHDASDHDPGLATFDLPGAPVQRLRPLIVGDVRADRWVLGFPGLWRVDEGSLRLSFRWLRCTSTAADTCAPIAGATGLLYRVQRGDRGAYLRFEVTATGTGGATVGVSPPERVR